MRLFSLFFFFFSLSLIFHFFFNLKDGKTPLFIAAEKGHKQIVQILLDKGGANVDLATRVFFYLFILICVEILILFSLFFFLFFTFSFFYFFYLKNGETPLYFAVKKGDEQIIQSLLERGANVDLVDKVLLINSLYFVLYFSIF